MEPITFCIALHTLFAIAAIARNTTKSDTQPQEVDPPIEVED